MTVGALRLVLRLVAAAGIPGIIVSSIADSNEAAITFGAVTAIAAFGLIVLTAATTQPPSDALGAAIEARVSDLVSRGADESEVRALLADAVKFGQQHAS